MLSGFLGYVRHRFSKETLTPKIFQRGDLIESYFDYLKVSVLSHSFLPPFIHSFIYSFIPFFLPSFLPSFIHSFIHSFQDEKQLSAATISNHASSLLYPLKYFYRREAPNFFGVPIIAQLRKAATLLQKQGEADRPKTREDLKALNKWLD